MRVCVDYVRAISKSLLPLDIFQHQKFNQNAPYIYIITQKYCFFFKNQQTFKKKQYLEQWTSRMRRRLLVACPADYLLDGRLFAVHEYADAVYFTGEPYHEEETGYQQNE